MRSLFPRAVTALHKEGQMSHDRHRTGILTDILEWEREKTCWKSLKKNGVGWPEAHAPCFTRGPVLVRSPQSVGESLPPYPSGSIPPAENKKDR